MKKVIAAYAAVAILVLLAATPALAFEGGGRKPSEAPLITIGQHYTGQLNNHKDDANFGGSSEVSHWRLPPLSTRDVVVIDWHSVPFTRYPGAFPICLTLAQGIDDFNWGTVFDSVSDGECSTGTAVYKPSGSGTARTEITVQETSPSSSYLQFFSDANRTSVDELETYPYDFTVEPVLHYLAAAIPPVKRISAGGVLHATANLSTGAPAPDGLTFNLSVTWAGGGIANYTGVSGGGSVSFQLALPETAYGKQASFTVSHPADGAYQAVTTPKLEVLVAKPKPPGPTPCMLAERRELALTRQFKRVRRHANRARGPSRRSLHRRAARVKRELHAVRSEVNGTCGIA